ncbi:MAG TPA: serine/threonine-protein kinase [Gemmatimonadaceae bacterium]|nr:serine/threonine-protein kinase [Gemmatimonadaceae bacterium]
MFCPNCGNVLNEGAAFCGNCGTSITVSASVATVAADPHHGVAPINLTPGDGQGSGNDALLRMVKEQLGRDYRIESELGRGGMAVVYKGVEIALERAVALKVVPPDSANVGQAAERFRREAKLAASLDHPNIIPVYRVGQAGPLHYMAMKFVEGRAVDAVIEQQGALPLPVCIAILKASAAGLAFAHERKIVHRDIKPANILVDKDGRVMVSDFGIARALEEVSMTASGMMIGTPYYMSPEQCGGQKVSPQSDQYSLGIMGFQMLTGEVPFLADSMVGVIQHHYMTPVPDILQVRPEVPKELLDAVYCALNKDPADRFQTTRDMVQALENVPQTDAERAEADGLLRELSAGRAITRIRTGSLPPLALTISGPGPRVQPRPSTAPRPRAPLPSLMPRRRKKKNKVMLPAMGLIFVGLGSGVFLQYQNMQAEQKRVSDSTRMADSLAQERILSQTRGSRVIAGLPENVRVAIAGRLYANGETFSADTATYAASATAPGYEPLSTAIVMEAGRNDTIYLTMKPLNAQPGTPTVQQQRPQEFIPAAPRDSSEVRLAVIPLYADILIDGRKVGSGRVRTTLPVGPHTVRYNALNCDAEDRSIAVVKGEALIVPNLTMTCR